MVKLETGGKDADRPCAQRGVENFGSAPPLCSARLKAIFRFYDLYCQEFIEEYQLSMNSGGRRAPRLI